MYNSTLYTRVGSNWCLILNSNSSKYVINISSLDICAKNFPRPQLLLWKTWKKLLIESFQYLLLTSYCSTVVLLQFVFLNTTYALRNMLSNLYSIYSIDSILSNKTWLKDI